MVCVSMVVYALVIDIPTSSVCFRSSESVKYGRVQVQITPRLVDKIATGLFKILPAPVVNVLESWK